MKTPTVFYLSLKDVIKATETHEVFAENKIYSTQIDFRINDRTPEEIQKLIDSDEYNFFTEEKYYLEKLVLFETGVCGPIAIIAERRKHEDFLTALKQAIKEHFNPDNEPVINIEKDDTGEPFRVEMAEDGEQYNRELYLISTAEY